MKLRQASHQVCEIMRKLDFHAPGVVLMVGDRHLQNHCKQIYFCNCIAKKHSVFEHGNTEVRYSCTIFLKTSILRGVFEGQDVEVRYCCTTCQEMCVSRRRDTPQGGGDRRACRNTVNRLVFAIPSLKNIVFLTMGKLKCDTVARYF